MKKLLIICDVFPPAFAPRMGYLVKYLKAYDWDADILCEDNIKDNNFGFLVGENRILRVPINKDIVPENDFRKLLRLFFLKRNFIRNKYPFMNAVLNHFNKNDYKLILVSVGWNTFVLDAAYEIAKRWKMPFIADLRDIQEQQPKSIKENGIKRVFTNWRLNKFEKKVITLRNKALRHAGAITTVSPFHVKILSKFNTKVDLIYNGFDPEIFRPKPLNPQKIFKIVYLGAIIDINLRDPGLLFQAVSHLFKNNKISPKNLRIQFYIPPRDRKLITEYYAYSDIKEFVDFFDYVESSRIIEILSKSGISLILSNISNENGPKGIMTTKFFEYLGAERPILCVRSDEDVLEEAINKANAGVAARNVDEAYDFILDKISEWKESGFTTVSVNQEYKKQFSRKLQAKQFVDIFNKVIDSK